MKIKSLSKLFFLLNIMLIPLLIFAQEPITDKYNKSGGENGILGKAVTDILRTPNQSGKFQRFKGGSIYTSDRGTFIVRGPMLKKWGDHQYEQGVLSFPLMDEESIGSEGEKYQRFIGGIIYTTKLGTYAVREPILSKWAEIFGQALIGYPSSDELWTPDNSGKFQRFKGGNIYWKEGIGAFVIPKYFLKKYERYQFEQGLLGYPVSDVIDLLDGRGKFIDFEGGAIYWSKKTGAHLMQGKILEWYKNQIEFNFDKGRFHIPLGYPKTDVKKVPNTHGLTCEFESTKMEYVFTDGEYVRVLNKKKQVWDFLPIVPDKLVGK